MPDVHMQFSPPSISTTSTASVPCSPTYLQCAFFCLLPACLSTTCERLTALPAVLQEEGLFLLISPAVLWRPAGLVTACHSSAACLLPANASGYGLVRFLPSCFFNLVQVCRFRCLCLLGLCLPLTPWTYSSTFFHPAGVPVRAVHLSANVRCLPHAAGFYHTCPPTVVGSRSFAGCIWVSLCVPLPADRLLAAVNLLPRPAALPTCTGCFLRAGTVPFAANGRTPPHACRTLVCLLIITNACAGTCCVADAADGGRTDCLRYPLFRFG